ncbi:hypothetical protein K1T71_012432 [Dendrolimus kikuchii]|uniref:Uncharacterized protein n=1 Tax=Dendrolimus kikuchii TaxID=765133 RepID=A0ACC1CJQ8_9NEOP|nr:hypothetical protein K1T71_012432 [Dendrolimus kikuchii]
MSSVILYLTSSLLLTITLAQEAQWTPYMNLQGANLQQDQQFQASEYGGGGLDQHDFGVQSDLGGQGHDFGGNFGGHFGGHDLQAHAYPVHQHVEEEVPETIKHYKEVVVPVHKNFEFKINQPIIIPVPQPIPIQVPVPKAVVIPIIKEVSIPVEKSVPYPVEKVVHVPKVKEVPFEVVKHIIVPVPKPVPFKQYNTDNNNIYSTMQFNEGCTVTDGTNHGDSRRDSAVQAYLHNIESDVWEEDEKACVEATRDMLNSVTNRTLWAAWIWDSMQYPTGVFYGSRFQLGNYDQCLNPPWLKSHPNLATQYCVVEVQTAGNPSKMLKDYDPYDNVSSYLQTASKSGRHFNKIFLSLCVSTKCQQKTVEKLSRHWLQGTHFSHPKSRDYKLEYCTDNSAAEYTFGFKAFFVVIATLLIIVVISTIYRAIDKKKSSSAVGEIAECFDVQHNWNLLYTVHPDDMPFLNGIRILTAYIVILMHISMLLTVVNSVNGLDIDETIYNSSFGYIPLHIDLVVDTFFVLSSLLLTKNLLAMNGNGIYLNPIKRYIRLIGVFAIVVFYTTAVSTYFSSGPYKTRLDGREQKICEKTWWKQLLMMDVDAIDMCCIHTWSVTCDYQLSLLATVLLFILIRNRKLGYVAFGITFLLALFIPGFITYRNNLFVSPVPTTQHVIYYRENEMMNNIYTKSYARAGSYLVGMAMGYVIFQYNPAKYRNTISKKFSVIGIVVALAMMLASLATGKITTDRPYDPVVSGIISAIDRPVWALAVCIIIGICEYGNSYYRRVGSDRDGHSSQCRTMAAGGGSSKQYLREVSISKKQSKDQERNLK